MRWLDGIPELHGKLDLVAGTYTVGVGDEAGVLQNTFFPGLTAEQLDFPIGLTFQIPRRTLELLRTPKALQ